MLLILLLILSHISVDCNELFTAESSLFLECIVIDKAVVGSGRSRELPTQNNSSIRIAPDIFASPIMIKAIS